MRLNSEFSKKVLDLRNANDELEAFNSTVSHDLRNPLLVIRGFSERILEKYRDKFDEKFSNQMGTIQKSALKMEQLIDDLLAFSRLGKQAMQHAPVFMDDLIKSVIEELRIIYPEGKVLVNALASCFGDERMLRQVFINLFSNAFKFSSNRAKRVIEIGCVEQANENIYFVKDNGAGLDMQYKDRFFNVFQRLHSLEEFGRTGMGLAIVKRIISLHGGTVRAKGKPDAGATFYVTLPRLSERLQHDTLWRYLPKVIFRVLHVKACHSLFKIYRQLSKLKGCFCNALRISRSFFRDCCDCFNIFTYLFRC